MAKRFLLIGAGYGGLAVALGAFGAHALKERLGPELLRVWDTAVQYQAWHALALLAVGLLALRAPSTALCMAGAAFALGVLLLSGSLYVRALTGVRGLGAITPLGGVAFLLGWAALLVAVARMDSP